MNTLKMIALFIVVLYFAVVILLYAFQTKLIFYPGKLRADYSFKLGTYGAELFITTEDNERINALLFRGSRKDVILYFHGNAGDLSGWQFIADDFTGSGYNVMIIDYRGYGKSSGSISESGLYLDATAAFDFLVAQGFSPESIILYGRSVGTGVAIDLASKRNCKGIILESPFSSLKELADEKLPLFFPSLYTKFAFENVKKINRVKSPIVFLHGQMDTLIPVSHTEKLFNRFQGNKIKILLPEASHNDINSFPRYSQFLRDLPSFFN